MQEAIVIEKKKIAAVRAKERYNYLREHILNLENKIKPHYNIYDIETEYYNMAIRIRMEQLDDECQKLLDIIKLYLFGDNWSSNQHIRVIKHPIVKVSKFKKLSVESLYIYFVAICYQSTIWLRKNLLLKS